MNNSGMELESRGKASSLILVIAACASFSAQAASPKKLPLVAVMPLSGQGVDSASAQVVSDVLSNELLRTGKVRVMERSQMEKILKEQGFQQSGSCDGSECAVEMGKLLSIDKMVVGSLGKLGGSYSVSLRAVDVGTGEVVGSSQKMQRGEIDEVAANLLPSVARELALSLNPDEAKVAINTSAPPFDSTQSKPKAIGSVPLSTSPVKTVEAAPVPVAVLPAPLPANFHFLPSQDSTPLARKTPASNAVKEDESSNLGLWIAGGIAVAGGATAAILLLSGKDSSPTATPAATPSTTPSTDITAKWSN